MYWLPSLHSMDLALKTGQGHRNGYRTFITIIQSLRPLALKQPASWINTDSAHTYSSYSCFTFLTPHDLSEKSSSPKVVWTGFCRFIQYGTGCHHTKSDRVCLNIVKDKFCQSSSTRMTTGRWSGTDHSAGSHFFMEGKVLNRRQNSQSYSLSLLSIKCCKTSSSIFKRRPSSSLQ